MEEQPSHHSEFLEAARADASSMEHVLHEYREPLLRRIRMMMGPRARRHAESVDFMHDVFRTAVDESDRLRGLDREGFLRWLTATARNRIRASVRSRREKALESMSVSLDGLYGPSPDRSPSRSFARRERIDRLTQAVESLRDDYRRVIELRDLEGKSFRDVGKALGRSEAAVQMLHTRAIVKLGAELRRIGADPPSLH